MLGQVTVIVCQFVFSIQCGSASHCIGGPSRGGPGAPYETDIGGTE